MWSRVPLPETSGQLLNACSLLNLRLPLCRSITISLLSEKEASPLLISSILSPSQAPVSLEIASANFVFRGTSSRSGRGGRNHSSLSTGRGHSTPPSFKSNRGKVRGRNSPNDARLVCQVCNHAGHVGLHCYYRFDNSYYNERFTVMQAYFSTQQAPTDPNWYTDTGATNHLTSNLANLNVHF
uniref:Uncharacterized protein n=1 Tax=Fagus sylvatica TaxID=28930 RepID=A0A2N9FHE9_FAGSY